MYIYVYTYVEREIYTCIKSGLLVLSLFQRYPVGHHAKLLQDYDVQKMWNSPSQADGVSGQASLEEPRKL